MYFPKFCSLREQNIQNGGKKWILKDNIIKRKKIFRQLLIEFGNTVIIYEKVSILEGQWPEIILSCMEKG